uniref:Uncharacterized protein n=1 Tax=Amphimedon queenslandica TaxID=400682 RepID=A0A1X7UNI6_AMPQE
LRKCVAKCLLQKHQYRVDRRHFAPTSRLPLQLNEQNTFPEKIEKIQNLEEGDYVKFVEPGEKIMNLVLL